MTDTFPVKKLKKWSNASTGIIGNSDLVHKATITFDYIRAVVSLHNNVHIHNGSFIAVSRIGQRNNLNKKPSCFISQTFQKNGSVLLSPLHLSYRKNKNVSKCILALA